MSVKLAYAGKETEASRKAERKRPIRYLSEISDFPEIEKNVPVRNFRSLRREFFSRLQDGDSWVCKNKAEYDAWMTAIGQHRRAIRPKPFHYQSHKMKDGTYRIWKLKNPPRDL